MINRRNSAALVVAACLGGVASGSDSRLWYDRPAEIWVEALPIGNGRLGAMVSPEKDLRFSCLKSLY
jgi:hypothetical protein